MIYYQQKLKALVLCMTVTGEMCAMKMKIMSVLLTLVQTSNPSHDPLCAADL